MVREATNRRRVRPLVVVHHDHHGTIRSRNVVQRLPRHSPGKSAVADDGDHVTGTEEPSTLPCLGQAIGIRDRGGRVGVFHDVVRTFLPRGIPRQTAFASQRVEFGAASGKDLVHVRLMTRVPNNGIVGRVEDSMKGDRQLNDAEIRTEMPTGRGHLLD